MTTPTRNPCVTASSVVAQGAAGALCPMRRMHCNGRSTGQPGVVAHSCNPATRRLVDENGSCLGATVTSVPMMTRRPLWACHQHAMAGGVRPVAGSLRSGVPGQGGNSAAKSRHGKRWRDRAREWVPRSGLGCSARPSPFHFYVLIHLFIYQLIYFFFLSFFSPKKWPRF